MGWLVWLLGRADEIAKELKASVGRYGSRPYRMVQLMYALLRRRGPLDFGVEQPNDGSAFFEQDASRLLGGISDLSALLAAARRGEYVARIARGELVLERGESDLSLFELGQNIAEGVEHAAPISLDEWDEGVLEAQRIAFGCAVQDLYAHIDPQGPDTGLTGTVIDGVAYVDLARSTREARALVEAFMLTHDRVRRFEAPFFFDLGPPADSPRSDGRIVDEAADALWLVYYPYLEALTARRPPDPMALTTPRLIQQALNTADHTQAHLIERARQKARARDDADGVKVALLVREVHAAFERQVAGILARAGLTACAGVTEIDRTPLPCGEIDVLACGMAAGGAPMTLVCEAKNVDLALHKGHAYEILSATLEHAQEQVARKAAWAAGHCDEVGRLLERDTAGGVTVGLIVTRRAVPLPLLGRWPGAVPSELEGVVLHLLETPVAEWRADLAAGVVDA